MADSCADCQPSPPPPAEPQQQADLEPIAPPHRRITIEFCNRCRWLHRATWCQTELFLTFDTVLQAITLLPLSDTETAGRFRVWVYADGTDRPALAWDRKVEGRFPEMKELKQRVRDIISPEQHLGHADVKGHQASNQVSSSS